MAAGMQIVLPFATETFLLGSIDDIPTSIEAWGLRYETVNIVLTPPALCQDQALSRYEACPGSPRTSKHKLEMSHRLPHDCKTGNWVRSLFLPETESCDMKAQLDTNIWGYDCRRRS